MNTIKHIISIFILLLTSQLSAQSAHSLLRTADKAYDQSNYATAEEGYRKSSSKDASYNSDYNLANTLYQQERYEEAAQYYQSAVSKAQDDKLKANAYHNLGNTLFNEQKLKESIDAYKQALRLTPNDMETKYNLQKTKQLIKQQQQQQQQQQNSDENQDQQDQDKDKKDQDQQDKDKQNQEDKDKQDQDKDQDKDKDKQDQDKDKKDQDQQDQDENQDDSEKSASDQDGSTNTGEEDKKTLDKEDALKLLQVIENEEKKVQEKLHRIKNGAKKPEKDW